MVTLIAEARHAAAVELRVYNLHLGQHGSLSLFYKIQAGDRVWHLNFNEPAVQASTPGPPLIPGGWFEYEIVVQGDNYTVDLTNTQTGARTRTTTFHNTDGERGRSPGFIGVQSYPGHTVAWRHIRVKT